LSLFANIVVNSSRKFGVTISFNRSRNDVNKHRGKPAHCRVITSIMRALKVLASRGPHNTKDKMQMNDVDNESRILNFEFAMVSIRTISILRKAKAASSRCSGSISEDRLGGSIPEGLDADAGQTKGHPIKSLKTI
jgi:hypothetical protein